MKIDEKIGITYFNSDRTLIDVDETESTPTTSEKLIGRRSKHMSHQSLNDDDSCGDETLTVRSGFGRDSFSTPDEMSPEAMSRLVEKEMQKYKSVLRSVGEPHSSHGD